MTYEVVFAVDARCAFTLIFAFLVDSHVGFGNDTEAAIMRAQSIREDITRLGQLPGRRSLREDMLTGLRHLTIGQAIAWFDMDEYVTIVCVLAVFLGGHDPIRRMVMRLLCK